MTKKVLFTYRNEFLQATDKFVMSFIELFFTTDKTNQSENITYVLDYLDRFNELYNKQKLVEDDYEYVLSFFTKQGILDTIESAFEFRIAPVLAWHIYNQITNFLIQLLRCKTESYKRTDVRIAIKSLLD